FIEDGSDDPAVGRVQAHDADPAAHGRHHPRLGERLVVAHVVGPGGAERLPEVRDHVLDAAAAGDGPAVPPALAVLGQGVAVSASFVSCIRSTSGRARASHHSTLSRRAFSELTFQVAIRTDPRLPRAGPPWLVLRTARLPPPDAPEGAGGGPASPAPLRPHGR